jgi:hypothetical protein
MSSPAPTSSHIEHTARRIDAMLPARFAPIYRQCSICVHTQAPQPALAVLHAPTTSGPWANMCLIHATTHAVSGFHAVGTRLLLEATAQLPWIPPTPTAAPANPTEDTNQ